MSKIKILVVDDEPEALQASGIALRHLPDSVIVLEHDSRYAVELLRKERFDLVLTDLRMPNLGGQELLQTIRETDPEQIVVVMTGFPTVDTAIDCLRLGASDYVIKPIDPEALKTTIRRLVDARKLRQENTLLIRQIARPYSFDEFVGGSPAIQNILNVIRKVAAADVDVLVTGETGVGKELVAQSIHRGNWRASGHFVPVDCSAVPESLMESDLFGHERGAFPGADRTKLGLLELADRGTLFLDEVTALPLSIQPKFLRALQERCFRRVGGVDEIAVNVRIIVATNRDLPELVRQGRFREELYYRIKTARIDIPGLRERVEDIPLIVNHFVEKYSKEMSKSPMEVDAEAMELLGRFPWPGNVRELQNVVKWSVAMSKDGRVMTDDIPEEVVLFTTEKAPPVANSGSFFDMRAQQIARFEKSYLENLIRLHHGDVSHAAQEAQLPRGTLYRFLKKYSLNPEEYRR